MPPQQIHGLLDLIRQENNIGAHDEISSKIRNRYTTIEPGGSV